MALHNCPDCGMTHDTGVPITNAEVEIARIQADAQVRIAELQSRADKHVADTYAEADVESAKAEAKAITAVYADQEADEHVVEAINAAAAGLDPVDDSAPADPMPMPEIVNVNENDDVTVPPQHEESSHEDSAPKKKSLFGNW
jgi:hypothetical protein